MDRKGGLSNNFVSRIVGDKNLRLENILRISLACFSENLYVRLKSYLKIKQNISFTFILESARAAF
jgi:hypothetical protein